jgi:hypothetical protein
MLPLHFVWAALALPLFADECTRSDQERNEQIKAGNVIEAASSVTDATGDLMGMLLSVPKEEADEVHPSHDQ